MTIPLLHQTFKSCLRTVRPNVPYWQARQVSKPTKNPVKSLYFFNLHSTHNYSLLLKIHNITELK